MSHKVWSLVVIFGLVVWPMAAFADTDHNTQIMMDAARHLSFGAWEGDNRAYLLVKQETVLAPVAVVFGYVDNATACKALAQNLSKPQSMMGTFKCQPIF